MLEAVIGSLPSGRQVVIAELQPVLDATFHAQPGTTGLGWPGVYRWCRQTIANNKGKLDGHALFSTYDMLVVQVDADVARTTYQKGHIEDAKGDLPCVEVCPPCSATTNRLRSVVLCWMGEDLLHAHAGGHDETKAKIRFDAFNRRPALIVRKPQKHRHFEVVRE